MPRYLCSERTGIARLSDAKWEVDILDIGALGSDRSAVPGYALPPPFEIEVCLADIKLALLAEAVDVPGNTDGRFAYGAALPGAEVVERAGPLEGAEEMGDALW